MADYLVDVRSKEAWQQQVEDKDLTTSPASPLKGDRYIIAGIGGDWSGGTINDIAQYNGTSWDFYTPIEGWICWIKDENKYYKYISSWSEYKEQTLTVGITIDGGGDVISTGYKGVIRVPYAGNITKVTLLADISGSIVIDIWKDIYTNYPPTDADSITASAPPTISSATKSEDSTLTGWTTAIAAGDVLAFNVDSCSTIKQVTLILEVTKS